MNLAKSPLFMLAKLGLRGGVEVPGTRSSPVGKSPFVLKGQESGGRKRSVVTHTLGGVNAPYLCDRGTLQTSGLLLRADPISCTTQKKASPECQ